MLLSIAIIMLVGVTAEFLCSKIKLPYVIGMLLVGILIGPYALNLVDPTILDISAILRKIALIIILLKAGIQLDLSDLKRVGRPAVLLCFLPATFEILAFLLFGPALLHISLVEAGIIGAVMGAVSPAIIVPRMSKMMEDGMGTKKGIPQMIIAGSSADDIYVIVIFTALISIAQGKHVGVGSFLQIPESIVLGILLGLVSGVVLYQFFQHVHMRDTIKVLILLSISFLFVALEDSVGSVVSVSGLLAVMSMGIMINNKYPILTTRLSGKFTKLWVGAEIFLFVLVGTTVNVNYVAKAGFMAVLMLGIGLVFRLFGTVLCLFHTSLNKKEKVFCMIAEIPKATVQAAIGGVPLAAGLPCGNFVLTVAVLSILITAPIGAIAIDTLTPKLIEQEEVQSKVDPDTIVE